MIRPETLNEVVAEAQRQDERWGDQSRHPYRPTGPGGRAWDALAVLLELEARASLHRGPSWSAILAEEVGEALQATDPAHQRQELVQVATVALQMVEAIDRGGAR